MTKNLMLFWDSRKRKVYISESSLCPYLNKVDVQPAIEGKQYETLIDNFSQCFIRKESAVFLHKILLFFVSSKKHQFTY